MDNLESQTKHKSTTQHRKLKGVSTRIRPENSGLTHVLANDKQFVCGVQHSLAFVVDLKSHVNNTIVYEICKALHNIQINFDG
jgi:hypothetical protein